MPRKVSSFKTSAAFASFLLPVLIAPLSAQSAVITTGDVFPAGLAPGSVTSEVNVGGNFTTPGTGSVVINGSSTLTTVNPNPFVIVAPLAGSDGTVTVTDPGSLWRIEGASNVDGGAFLVVGRAGNGTVNIENGGRIEIDSLGAPLGRDIPGLPFPAGFTLARDSGTTGVLNITGPGSELSVTSDFAAAFIGRSGNAETNITNGGKLSFSGINSDLNVVAEGSTNGVGVLNVNTGGTVEGSVFLDVGASPGANGTVNLDGVGSSITLTGACTADCPAGFSFPNQGAFLTVGANQGTGVFNITDGATLTIDSSGTPNAEFPGFSLGGSSILGPVGDGTLTVDGAGSLLNVIGDRAFFSIGRLEDGQGTLNILNGGQVIVENGDGLSTGFLGDRPGAEGNLNVNGSTSLLDAGNFLGVGVLDSDPSLDAGNGTLTLIDGGTVKADNLVVGLGGVVQGNGTLTGSTTTGQFVVDRGEINVGASVGTLTFDGDLTLEEGTILLEANSATDLDRINVTGDLIIRGGVLEILLGFTPDAGVPLEFFVAGNTLFEQGGFDDINVFALLGSGVELGTEVSLLIGGETIEAFVTAVPLPGGFVLLLSALGLLGFARFRFKRQSLPPGLAAVST